MSAERAIERITEHMQWLKQRSPSSYVEGRIDGMNHALRIMEQEMNKQVVEVDES